MPNSVEEQRVKILANLPVFSNLTKPELYRIAEICTEKIFRAGEVIFLDSSPGTDMYVVLSGKVAIKLESITPSCEIGLSTVTPGEVFGEFSLLDHEPRSATATAIEDTHTLVVNGEQMRQLFEEQSHIGFVVLRNLVNTICAKIRRTNKKLLNLIRAKLYE
ncbi:MAG: Crp/Fnr family transcriptional regulator [Candidatus Sumerlaeia bacterium]|nr:Crp/Fnr family transcriptional regulator [Candidatus Sumerlaeia bacterium]